MQIAEPITADLYLAMDLEGQRTQLIDEGFVLEVGALFDFG